MSIFLPHLPLQFFTRGGSGGTRTGFRWEKDISRKVWKWEGVLGTPTSHPAPPPRVMEWKGRRPMSAEAFLSVAVCGRPP